MCRVGFDGSVAANSGSEIAVEIDSLSFQSTLGNEKCSGSGLPVAIDEPNLPWCLRSTALGVASFESCDSETALGFRLRMYNSNGTLLATCQYTAEKLDASYEFGDVALTMWFNAGQKFTKQSGGIACYPSLTIIPDINGPELTSEGNTLEVN